MVRLSEFVRDSASLGELKEFEHNLKLRVKASKGELRRARVPE